ncbi:hypothetical protein F5X97DRAFT_319182 [Nemania serpens]|nr:hypothetical protein F5X97DRAFT_319182 [Nemania serpens]
MRSSQYRGFKLGVIKALVYTAFVALADELSVFMVHRSRSQQRASKANGWQKVRTNDLDFNAHRLLTGAEPSNDLRQNGLWEGYSLLREEPVALLDGECRRERLRGSNKLNERSVWRRRRGHSA